MTRPNLVQTPLQEFDENIQYARALIAGGVALQGLQNFPAHPEDLYRAAWNQAVSAMDHWLHDELIDRAVQLANDTGNQRTQSMLNLRLPFEMVERTRSEPVYVVFRDFLKKEFQRRSFHGAEDITQGIKLVSHLTGDSIWNAVGRAFGMSQQQAKKNHEEIIKRRNDISHRADRDALGKRQSMTEAQATAAVDWIHDLVHELFGLLG
jgi:restriction system protein